MFKDSGRLMLLPLLLFLLLLASVVEVRSDCETDPLSTSPQGIHLAFAGNSSTEMVVSWFTCAMPQRGKGAVVTLSSGRSYEGSTSKLTRYHHDVKIEGLLPGRLYRGTVAGSSTRSFSFTTAPSSLDDALFTAAVIGDMGVNNTEGTIKMLAKREANFTIHVGDISYADDAGHGFVPMPSSGNGYDRIYDAYQNMVEPFASKGPYMTVGVASRKERRLHAYCMLTPSHPRLLAITT